MFRSLSIILVLVVAGCTSTSSSIPKNTDVLGKFVGDDGSYFLLTSDGKVSYHGIPAVWRDPQAKKGETVSGIGKWRLNKDILVVIARDQGDSTSGPTMRKIETFDVQGWFGLMLPIDTGDGSEYVLFYVPPERR